MDDMLLWCKKLFTTCIAKMCFLKVLSFKTLSNSTMTETNDLCYINSILKCALESNSDEIGLIIKSSRWKLNLELTVRREW